MGIDSRVLFHLKTAYLFIRSDIKTTVFPVSGFAFMVSPEFSTTRAPLVLIWVLIHLLLIDVDNQSLSIDEDTLNKPWRPLPSGRISISTAEFLSKALNPICLLVSWLLGGWELMAPSAVLCGLVYSYNHLHLSSNYVWKNLMNGFGYAALETGATTALVGSLPRRPDVRLALLLSWAVISTTIHVQDLADIEGDRKMGRRTIVIHFGQNATRISLAVFLVFWSFALPPIWGKNSFAVGIYTFLGIFLSAHIFFLRKRASDEESFRIYNAWLMLSHLLATNFNDIGLTTK